MTFYSSIKKNKNFRGKMAESGNHIWVTQAQKDNCYTLSCL